MSEPDSGTKPAGIQCRMGTCTAWMGVFNVSNQLIGVVSPEAFELASFEAWQCLRFRGKSTRRHALS